MLPYSVVHGLEAKSASLSLERVNYCASDFILERKYSLQFAFVGFRPKLKTVARINQLRGYSNAITLASHTSFKHVFDIQLFPNLAHVRAFPFE